MDAIRQELIDDAGGDSSLTGARRLLIDQVTRLEVMARALAGDVARKGPGTEAGRQSLHALLACLDRQARALTSLGIDRRAETVNPYAVIEAAVREANHEPDGASQPPGNGGADTRGGKEFAPHATAHDDGNGNPPADGGRAQRHEVHGSAKGTEGTSGAAGGVDDGPDAGAQAAEVQT